MRVGIVIPVLNEALGLPRLLAQFGPEHPNVVVVDGGSHDRSVVTALAAGFRVIQAERGRARQMNAGAAALADVEVLLFVHADVLLPDDWRDVVAGAIGVGAAWGRFDVRLESSRAVLKLVGKLMNLRSRVTGIATGDQAMFVTRAAFQQMGGWPDVPLMEDVRMSGRLLHAFGRPACAPQRVTVSARRWERHGIARTIALMWVLRALHAMGVTPRMLHRLYYGPALVAGPRAVEGHVIVFAKAPRLGEVKTRLAATLGADVALEAHRRLLERTIAQVAMIPGVSRELCIAGPDPMGACTALARHYGFDLTEQHGTDLGERMANAMQPALASGRRVVLVGCDSPILTAGDIAEALVELQGRDAAEVVLSPTEDGGYLLIGAVGRLPPVFSGMQWSHAEVLQQTLARLDGARCCYRLLRTLWDVDDEQGWRRWQAM